jgi:CheY-like chemotaxis protein
LKLLNTIFSKVDAKVTACSSARAGLLAMAELLPDVVICDLAMPYEDGYWFIEKVRSSAGPENKVPIIALTAYASVSDRERVLASGFQTFVSKPVEPAELLHSVMRIITAKNKHIPSTPAIDPGNFSLASKKILLVEDDLISAEMFRIAFENEDSDFRAVSRSSDALKILEEWIPDIIVSDLGLPDEDGYSLIKKIRANPSADRAQIPAIALTGYGKEEGARAIDSGFQMYRTKPIQPDTLISLVINLLRNS